MAYCRCSEDSNWHMYSMVSSRDDEMLSSGEYLLCCSRCESNEKETCLTVEEILNDIDGTLDSLTSNCPEERSFVKEMLLRFVDDMMNKDNRSYPDNFTHRPEHPRGMYKKNKGTKE